MKYSQLGNLFAVYLMCYLLVGSGFTYSLGCDPSRYCDPVEVDSVQGMSCFVVGERHKQRLSVPLVSESDSAISIRSKLTGYVSEIFVEEGDKVVKGENLVLIDDPALNDSLNAAYRNLIVARDKYENYHANFKRITNLFKNKLVSKDGYEAAELDHKISLAEYNSAKKQYKSSKQNSSYSLIQAPYDGLVRSVDAKVGELAQYGAVLLEFRKVDDLVLRGWVPASLINQVLLDGPVDVEVSGVSYLADVEFVSDQIDVSYQSVEVKLKTKSNIVGGISGMYGSALLKFSQERYGGYLIPNQSVVFHSGMYGVFVKNRESCVKFRWVNAGDDHGKMVEVISGLRSGEVILY